MPSDSENDYHTICNDTKGGNCLSLYVLTRHRGWGGLFSLVFPELQKSAASTPNSKSSSQSLALSIMVELPSRRGL